MSHQTHYRSHRVRVFTSTTNTTLTQDATALWSSTTYIRISGTMNLLKHVSYNCVQESISRTVSAANCFLSDIPTGNRRLSIAVWFRHPWTMNEMNHQVEASRMGDLAVFFLSASAHSDNSNTETQTQHFTVIFTLDYHTKLSHLPQWLASLIHS